MAVQAIIIKTVKFPVLNELLGSLYVDIACVAESIDLFSSVFNTLWKPLTHSSIISSYNSKYS